MLHQFLELRLKGFQATAGMNGGKSHNVEHLMKGLRGLLPQLQAIFPYDGPSVDLFRLLDQSYTKAKKGESIDIEPEEFVILVDKSEQAKAAMDEMVRSEEHTSELQSLMRTSYAVFCLHKKITY